MEGGKMIKKIRFELVPNSYGEMAHLEFFKKDKKLEVNTSKKTLTLANGKIVSFNVQAISEYNSDYTAIRIFNSAGAPSHSYDCWCTSGTPANPWVEITFDTPIPKNFANKLTFCCGQGHGSYPATFTLFFIDENGQREQIGEPLYVNAHNGIFEWTSAIPCLLGKNGLYYFLRPKTNLNK